jgi:hypothetical protein
MALWNYTYLRYFESWDVYESNNGSFISKNVWINLLKNDLSHFSDSPAAAGEAIKNVFSNGAWFDVYNLLQLISADETEDTIETYNFILEKYLAGYRIIGGEVTPLTDKQQVEEVEKALTDSGRFKGANHHLKTALTLYSRLEKPDYANSIKESISAVEAVARELTDKPTLGKALDQLKRDEPAIHSGLINGWKALYGYTSDEDAIRHGGPNAPDISSDMARYFLVTCSAFVNLLIGYAE